MAFILGFIGLLFGALAGGVWGAVALCAAGAWLGYWIKNRDKKGRERQGSAPAPAREVRPLLDNFDSLRNEVRSLRQRVDQLEAGRAAASPAQVAPVMEESAAP